LGENYFGGKTKEKGINFR